MEEELEDLKEIMVGLSYKSFRNVFDKFKDFNKFDEFVENCLQEGKEKFLSNMFYDQDSVDFEFLRKTAINTLHPANVQSNVAIMFAYNLDKIAVLNTINHDSYFWPRVKEELIKNERFEEIVEIEKILNGNRTEFMKRILFIQFRENYIKQNGKQHSSQ